ncbi:hypothetical protein [Rurimicrobium arvi]|uniref:Uncharacterized protein n=1 Tax=Rurimicrobium arvi TaxID=2049916 RepID=A0ABP8N0G1_9BACT
MSISDLILFVHDGGTSSPALADGALLEPYTRNDENFREAAITAGFDETEEIDPYHALLLHLKMKHHWDC